MKFKSKQVIAAVTAATLCAVPVTPATEVWADDIVPYVNTHESAFQGLSEQNQLIAREAKRQILEIAEGKRSDAILRINVQDALGIDVNDSKYSATLSELGLSKTDFDENGIAKGWGPSVAWQHWAERLGYFGYYDNGEGTKIKHAIWEECSFELFWHDKVTRGITTWPVSVVLKEDGTVGLDENSFVPITMGVRSSYQTAASSTDIYDSYTTGLGDSSNVNIEVTAAEANAVLANALAVVNQYADLSDKEKLTAYRDYILDAVSYDTASASLIGSSTQEANDAFFVKNVFDNDPSTNVVCEGYAKAFKFLCDLSSFEDPTIDVKLVTGKLTSQVIATASGDHMWNVVTLGGENYIADLTNSDGDKSSYDKLFLVGAQYYYGDYRVETNAGIYTFSYKESDGNNYNDSYADGALDITSNVIKKDNSWTTPLSIESILEGDILNPVAEAAVGEVSFLYASAADGEYTSEAPSAVGTWYVKAVVEESAEYNALESEPVAFEIQERTQHSNSWSEELTASDSVYGSELNVAAKAAYGTVKYLYSAEEDGTFTEEAPENAGTWYVKAVVETTADYTGLESEVESFAITKAENSWKTELSVNDITEGLKPAPKAVAAFGRAVFTYSTSANGTYTETVPSKAGTYYVKAAVAETDNYTGLESEAVSFKINAKAADPETEVPYVNDKDSAAANLNEQQLKIFNEAREQIRAIAAGDKAYAILEINVADTLDLDVNDSKYNASLSALGLSKSDFDANGKASIDANIAWQRWAENQGYFDYYTKGGSYKLNKALWADCAYDLYWHDRTVKGVGWWPITVYLKEDGTVGMTEASYIPAAFAVSSEYKAAENTSDEYRQYYIDHPNYGTPPNWDVDATKAKSTAKTTLTNAKKVVAAAADLSDYEKLEYYADYILKAVSYDTESAQHIGDSSYELDNAWQVPYVFDNNSSTNIVCEGYAKAFKFLCDMTTFEDTSIDVRLVTGPCNMSGQKEDHMWNVVTYAGKNYIVDLTNSDEGSVGEVGTLFMVPASYSSSTETYNLNGIYFPSAGEEGQSASRTSWNASYKYDDDTNATFSAEDLTIARELPVSYTDAKEAARAIAEQMKERKRRIVVQYTGSSSGLGSDVFTALRDLAYEHTGEAGFGDSLRRQIDSAVPAVTGSSNVYVYNVKYYNDASSERKLEADAAKVISDLELEGKSDYQKARAIYNWLCRNVHYDRANEGNMSNLLRYSAAGAISERECVCSGYANAFYYLACLAGLENRIVVSKDHAWNIVKLGEYYYNVDATWDASYYDPELGYSANYNWRFFMKNDATYLQENYPSSDWGSINGEHHTRLSYDTGDAEFITAHPMSPTNYGETENGITFKENNGTITITGYTGDAAELIVPDSIAGEKIGTINANALADQKLTKITFTSDVETIQEGAFDTGVTLVLAENCTNLIAYANAHNIKTEGVTIPQEENSWTAELTIEDVEIGGTPAPKAEAAYGEVTYKFAAEKDGEYSDSVPSEAGTWYVKAYVEETETYTGLESDAVSFRIKKAENSWVKTLSIDDIKFGETPAPSAEAKYGEVRYEYRKGFSGEWSDTVPTEASGSLYYVRAIVDETEAYTGLESNEAGFFIDAADNEWTKELTIEDITEGEELHPSAEAKYGEVVYEYSSNGYSYSAEVPTEPGTYYVRARVSASDSYSGLTSAGVEFKINEKPAEEDDETEKNLEAAAKFTDVSETSPFRESIGWAVRSGVTSGKTESTFAPSAYCTRAQIVTFLWKAEGQPEPTSDTPVFNDVKTSAYYYKAVQWAFEQGIVAGSTGSRFNPESSCTRSMAVTYLWRVAGGPEVENETSFSDVRDGQYFTTAVSWAAQNGITAGFKDGTFRPNTICTRGQIVTFLHRYYSNK